MQNLQPYGESGEETETERDRFTRLPKCGTLSGQYAPDGMLKDFITSKDDVSDPPEAI